MSTRYTLQECPNNVRVELSSNVHPLWPSVFINNHGPEIGLLQEYPDKVLDTAECILESVQAREENRTTDYITKSVSAALLRSIHLKTL